MLYSLHAVGAPRCRTHTATCGDGCGPGRRYDGEPPPHRPMARPRTDFDAFLDDALCSLDAPLGWVPLEIFGARLGISLDVVWGIS